MTQRTPLTIRFYTSNEGKVREVRELLEGRGYRVAWARRELTEPQADDLEEVARAKLAAVPRGKDLALVEDSGIFVAALGGFPGVYSAYVLRTLGLPGILRLVDGKPRAAEFRAVVGLREGTRTRFFHGAVKGTLAPRPRGSGGFGYDPIFIPDGKTQTTAEMTSAEKNALSHRGKALRGLARYLAPPGRVSRSA